MTPDDPDAAKAREIVGIPCEWPGACLGPTRAEERLVCHQCRLVNRIAAALKEAREANARFHQGRVERAAAEVLAMKTRAEKAARALDDAEDFAAEVALGVTHATMVCREETPCCRCRAEKAERERDALRAELERLRRLPETAPFETAEELAEVVSNLRAEVAELKRRLEKGTDSLTEHAIAIHYQAGRRDGLLRAVEIVTRKSDDYVNHLRLALECKP